MRNSQMNWYLRIGLLMGAFVITANRFLELPDSFSCILLGLSFALELIGLVAYKQDFSKLRRWKKSIVMKLIK